MRPPRKPRLIPPALLLAALAVLAAGCQSGQGVVGHPGSAWDEPEHGLLHRSPGAARSLAMDSAAQMARSAQAGPIGLDPWYSGRNDELASVVYGGRSSVFEETETFTRDAQTIRGGRVQDRFNQTTFRRRVQRLYR